jgi:hypothetical protein
MEYKQENIQASSVIIKEHTGELTISAIYCPPKHNNKCEDFDKFSRTQGNKFIVAGDFNAKNTVWGSRTTATKGRELLHAMRNNNLSYFITVSLLGNILKRN